VTRLSAFADAGQLRINWPEVKDRTDGTSYGGRNNSPIFVGSESGFANIATYIGAVATA
jgi:hypothetical protein